MALTEGKREKVKGDQGIHSVAVINTATKGKKAPNAGYLMRGPSGERACKPDDGEQKKEEGGRNIVIDDSLAVL